MALLFKPYGELHFKTKQGCQSVIEREIIFFMRLYKQICTTFDDMSVITNLITLQNRVRHPSDSNALLQ
jgi:hypothetical protein